MKRMLLGVCVLVLAALPAYAAEDAAGGNKGMQHMMHHEPGMMQPGMMRQMMQNPQHLLAMAYHKNLLTFGGVLKKAAQKSDTLPGEVVRAAVTEMRRSQTQMEIYHEEAARNLTQDQRAQHAEMAKAMSAHMAQAKTQLAQLDELAKADRVDSRELLKRLEPLLAGCREMGGMHGPGMPGHGKGMHGKGPCGCMHGDHQGCCGKMGCGAGPGCQGGGKGGCCGHCGPMQPQTMRRGGPEGWSDMMRQRQKMMAAMKEQDAELTRLVDAMNRAPQDKKQAIMADLLTRMVRQRAEMVAQMEQLQEHLKRHGGGPAQRMAAPGVPGEGNYDPDSMNADDMDSDADFDDVDVDDGDMDMGGMQMQE